VARPTLGRAIATTLRAAGYEVHRTPGDADLDGLVARLQAHLAIVALDLPWLNAIDAVSPLIDRRRPVLLLGDAGGDSRVEGVPRLPLLLNAALLLEAVSSLLVSSDP
jgi:DNA-binding response OmpR family regulator